MREISYPDTLIGDYQDQYGQDPLTSDELDELCELSAAQSIVKRPSPAHRAICVRLYELESKMVIHHAHQANDHKRALFSIVDAWRKD